MDEQSQSSLDAEIKNAEEVIKKLQKFADTLDTKKHPNDNILTHLCDGLETFLGFNSATKGYDGSGIVYSDLDRLCDGVMGFLSGVLGAVKNENEVITYDNYITRPNKKLNEVLDELTKKIGSGRAGLAASVDAVKGWLEGYKREVKEKTETLKNHVNTILTSIDNDKQQIEKDKFFDISKQITEWTQRSKWYVGKATDAKNALNDIDPTLSGKLTSNIEMLLQATKTFEEAARNGDLDNIETLASKTLTEIISKIETAFHSSCEKLKNYLKDNIGTLHEKMIKLQGTQFNDLFTFINDELLTAFDAVNKKINSVINDYDTNVVGELKTILANANTLKQKVADEKRIIKHLVGQLTARMGELTGAHTTVMELVANTRVDDFKNADNGWNLSQQIESLKTQIVTVMKKHVGEKILSSIKKEVSIIKEKIGDKNGLDSEENRRSIDKNFDLLKRRITGDVALLTTNPRNSGILGGIVKGINEYLKNVGDGFDDGILQTWIGNIMDEVNGQARKYIDYYVRNNTHNLRDAFNPRYNGESGTEAVIKVIKENLPHFVKDAIKIAAGDAGISSTDTLKGLSGKIKKFGVNITTELVEKDKVEETVRAIQEALGVSKNSPNNYFLTQSVTYILNSVAVSATSFANELHSFVEASDIENLPVAVGMVKTIGDQFGISDNSFGHKIETELGVIKPVITKLHEQINMAHKKASRPEEPIHGYTNTELADKVVEIDTKFEVTEVKSTLETLLRRTANAAIGKLQEAVTNIANGKLELDKVTLRGIKEQLESLQTPMSDSGDTGATNGNSNLEQQANALHGKIEKFLNDNVGKTDGPDEPKEGSAYAELNDLMGKIGMLKGKVGDVRSKVEAVAVELTSCIRKTERLLKYAPMVANKTMNELKTTVRDDITSGFLDVQKKAKDLYTKRKTQEVAALQKIVETQLNEITQLIDDDKKDRLKGLFAKLRRYFVGPHTSVFPFPAEPDKSAARTLSTYAATLIHWFNDLFLDLYTQRQVKLKRSYVEHSREALQKLLNFLASSQHFNNEFAVNLFSLKIKLSEFHADTYKDNGRDVLAPLKSGLAKFAEQLGHAYVNRYSGVKRTDEWVTTETKQAEGKDKPEKITKLSTEGRNCAKVCLTILEMVHDAFDELKNKCSNAWYGRQINSISSLGGYFKRNGFIVSTGHTNQDGELRNKGEMMGEHIIKKLIDKIAGSESNEHLKKCKDDDKNKSEEEKAPAENKDVNVIDVLTCFFKHIQQYNEVGHYVVLPKPRMPCNAYEMLVWFTGLMYNKAYASLLHDGFTGLLEKPAKTLATDNEGLQSFDRKLSFLNAYPDKITYGDIEEIIGHISVHSHELLTTILGTGDEHTTYTCDYSNNSLGLFYPQKGDDCLHTILDILRRLFPVLSFLRTQCSFGASDMGWADCRYGKDIPTTKSHCSKESKAQAKCQAECQPNYKPNCQPTSPLMCYLGDSLLGCLPHRVESVGCSSKCATCPSGKPGMPCLTPLGFRSFSGSTKTGSDLCEVVSKFFGRHVASCLFSLVAKPPSTLPEHFGFALSLVKKWDDGRSHVIKDGITSAITDRSIALYEKPSDLIRALKNVYGSSQSNHDIIKHPQPVIRGKPTDNKKYGDLSSLAMSTACTDQNAQCAPYLNALCADQYAYLASKQCNAYLSWAVYLPWTFWNYLASLYDAFRDIYCQDWGCRTCLRADTCRRGQHGLVNDKTKAPNCNCSSIVECKGAMPTLYKYGFTFGAPAALNGQSGKKTCTNFMDQLNNVLQSTYFQTLFDKCDDFLWNIREPFTWTVVALWLLSLLYLIHIMVIRLDLLHIKSHLHSPSSHRIAAQSLLAAGRVNKLNRVFYLQP